MLVNINKNDYNISRQGNIALIVFLIKRLIHMKYISFVNELKSKGVVFVNKTNHIKLYLNGKESTLKRHPSR